MPSFPSDAGLTQVPRYAALAGAGVGIGAGTGAGCGRNIKKATTPRATTAAATIPRTSGTPEGRLERSFSAGAVGGGNCTATVACTGAVSVAAVGATYRFRASVSNCTSEVQRVWEIS